MSDKIFVLDTTLRDGAQSAGVSFSLEDKIKILKILDGLGVDFAEAGYPSAQQKDESLFRALASGEIALSRTKVVAFTSTCHPGISAYEDAMFVKAVELSGEYIAICGKASAKQVAEVLSVSPEENLRMIRESVEYAISKGKKVIFDAEHYFDGYIDNADYALSAAMAAVNGGAERIILCDTNGGMMPEQVKLIVSKTREATNARIGIHCHNDCGLAVANTIAAVNYGASDIHGTVCGIGERCGNTNLCTAIPDLQIKLGYNLIPDECMRKLSGAARSIADIANIVFDERDPYVGRYAFSHKAGQHIDGSTKAIHSFEHCEPEAVGNVSRLLLSEQSGKAAVWERIRQLYPEIAKDDPRVKNVLERIKSDEYNGCRYEDADGSLALIILEAFSVRKPFFELLDFKVVLGDPDREGIHACAMLKLCVNGNSVFAAAEGEGPVNAMDVALRKGLEGFYPALTAMRLTDYKVRVIDSGAATAALVRVCIESADGSASWRTVGVSSDIIKASWKALRDSVEYKLSLSNGLV